MYRFAEVPTDSTLERVEAGIPHAPCRSELNPSCVMVGLCLTAFASFAVVEGLRVGINLPRWRCIALFQCKNFNGKVVAKCQDMMSDTWYALSQTTLWYSGRSLLAVRRTSLQCK